MRNHRLPTSLRSQRHINTKTTHGSPSTTSSSSTRTTAS
jgi:hypothetical protein